MSNGLEAGMWPHQNLEDFTYKTSVEFFGISPGKPLLYCHRRQLSDSDDLSFAVWKGPLVYAAMMVP